MKVRAVLFKPSGKYYTEEDWEIPEKVPHPDSLLAKQGRLVGPTDPSDMRYSKDFRRIDGGPVLIPESERWGWPALLVKYVVEEKDK